MNYSRPCKDALALPEDCVLLKLRYGRKENAYKLKLVSSIFKNFFKIFVSHNHFAYKSECLYAKVSIFRQ